MIEHSNIPSLPDGDNAITYEIVERALHDAVRRRDLDDCQRLLSQNAFEAIPESGQFGLLSSAIQKGFTAGALAVIERLATKCTSAPAQYLLLSLAARAGDLEVCKALIGTGLSVDVRSLNGATPLCGAASRGHASVCAYLLECGADPHNAPAPDHYPLHKAASRDCVDTCRVLIDGGADPDFIPVGAAQAYLTPFQAAIAFAFPNLVNFYIDSFPHLLYKKTLDGRSMADIAEPTNRSLVLAAITANAVLSGLTTDVDLQGPSRDSKIVSPL